MTAAHECLDCHHTWTDDEPDEDDDWSPIPLGEIARSIIDGTLEAILPTVLAVADHLPLLYPGRVNSIFGESGGGKTWVSLAAVAEVARQGARVLFLDFEDHATGIAERLVLLGLTPEECALVDYRNPSTGIGVGVTRRAIGGTYGLVVIDSTGEAMATAGTDSNSDAEVAVWFAMVKQVARMAGDAAVLILDHVPKDKEAPSAYAIGSQRKRAAVTGAAYRVDTLKEPAKGRDGKLKLTVAKDRFGNRPKGSVACEVRIGSTGAAVTIELAVSDAQAAAEHGERFRPTVLMERVSRHLETVPTASQRSVCRDVSGKTEALRTALDCLVEEGYARLTPMGYEHVQPFREAVDNSSAPPRPTAPLPRPGARPEWAERPTRPRAPRLTESGARGAGRGGSENGEEPTSAPPVDNYDQSTYDTEELF